MANCFTRTILLLLLLTSSWGRVGLAEPLFPGQKFLAGSRPNSVAIGDFNTDGVQDLAVANFNSDDVSVLLGQGDGTFAPQLRFAAGDGPFSVAVGDFDADGRQDLAVANINSDDVSVLLGQGDGTFAAPLHGNVEPGTAVHLSLGGREPDHRCGGRSSRGVAGCGSREQSLVGMMAGGWWLVAGGGWLEASGW